MLTGGTWIRPTGSVRRQNQAWKSNLARVMPPSQSLLDGELFAEKLDSSTIRTTNIALSYCTEGRAITSLKLYRVSHIAGQAPMVCVIPKSAGQELYSLSLTREWPPSYRFSYRDDA